MSNKPHAESGAAVRCSAVVRSQNVKDLEKTRDELACRLAEVKEQLACRLAEVKEQIAEIKRREKEAKRRRETDEQRKVVSRVLNGECVSDVARSLGVTPPRVHVKLQRLCRRANPELYEAGIKHGSTSNYCTPPLQYLRHNKRGFGF